MQIYAISQTIHRIKVCQKCKTIVFLQQLETIQHNLEISVTSKMNVMSDPIVILVLELKACM